MRLRVFFVSLVLVFAFSQFLMAGNASHNVSAQHSDAFAKLPLSFESATPGQFLSRSGSYTLSVGAIDSYIALKGRGTGTAKVLHFSFDRGNKAALAEGMERLAGVVNYYRGNDPKNWRVGLPMYAKVMAKNVYPGVDVVYYGDQRRLEFDFVVAPHSDPGAIAVAFTGADQLSISAEGDLVAKVGDREVRFVKPFAYQRTDEKKTRVTVAYALEQGKARMVLGDYDKSQELIIDPVLTYSSFLGGSLADEANALAVDTLGNTYVAGQTCSSDFPNPSGAIFAGSCDAFVTKLNATGTAVVYTTFIAGQIPDPPDATASASAIALDATGQAYIAGTTNFWDLPGTSNPPNPADRPAAYNGGDSDAFIAILKADGSLLRETYLGGSDIDQGYGIVVDRQLNISVVGQTCSDDFPGYNSIQPKTEKCVAFATKLDSGLHIPLPVLPGASPLSPRRHSLTEDNCRIGAACPPAADQGNPSSTYYFFSSLFGGQPQPPEASWPSLKGPSYRPGVQVPVGAITIGTPDCKVGDKPQVLLAEPAGDPYISGTSVKLTWPCSGTFMKAGIQDDGGFVWYDLGDAPPSIVFASTEAYGVALDPVNDVFVVGGTNTATLAPYLFYGSVNGYHGINYGKTGPWALKLGGLNGDQIYATALGTSPTDLSQTVNAARGITVDTSGNAYVVGTATDGILFTPGVAQSKNAGGPDAFVVKLNKPASAFDYATYLGGSGSEQGLAIAIDSGGAAYITGSTTSVDLPVMNPIENAAGDQESSLLGAQDAFIARLTPNASAVTMMAYLGGAATEQGNAISVDTSGNIYVAGTTQSVDFPVFPATVVQPLPGHGTDAFVTLINGASFPQASLSAGSLSFGTQNVGTSSATKTITLSNTGNGSLSIASIGMVATAGDFSQTNNCGTSLTPVGGSRDQCTIIVTFTPTVGGSRTDVLQVVDNSNNSPQIVSLSGNGIVVQGSLQLSPTTLAFGNQETGTTSAAKMVTLTNTSPTYALTISGIAVAGDFKQTNNCPVSPATLAANANCQIQVTFAPVATGSQSVNLIVSGIAANSPQSITLTGTGTTLGSSGTPGFNLTSSSPSITVAYTGGTATFNVYATPLNGFNQTLNFTCAIPGGASCSLSPSTLIMDGTSVPSVTATVTIAGSGGGTPPVRTGELHRGLKPIFASLLPFCAIGMVLVGKNRRLMAVLLIVLVATLIFTVGCGGGGGKDTITSNANTMTPGIYQVTITGASTGTGAVTHLIAVPFTVK
jgi:Abnormal spindle-like microcephaly-assoc'd, ASPM-SPD-2-Hydin/Beta-propeller repeat